jgi:hypothetical protein
MSALSIQVPFPVFQDRDGQPLDNGYVWIGTANLNPITNPVVAYFDSALTIVAAQPLRTLNGYISNAGTPAQIYVDGVNFSILVQDSKGSMVYNFPDGTGIAANAAGVIYDPAGTGAVTTNVQAKLRESVSVQDFGAVGDGVTDDYAAFQAAIDSLPVSGGTIIIPATASNSWVISQTLNVRKKAHIIGQIAQGTGILGTKLIFPANTSGIVFNSINTSLYTTVPIDLSLPGAYGSILENVAFFGDKAGSSTAADGVVVRCLMECRGVGVQNFSRYGFRIWADLGTGGSTEGNANQWILYGCQSTYNGDHGVYVNGEDANVGVATKVFSQANGGYGFYDTSLIGNTYIGCDTASNVLGPMYSVSTSSRVTLIGFWEDSGGTSTLGQNVMSFGGNPAASPSSNCFEFTFGVAQHAGFRHLNSAGSTTVGAQVGKQGTDLAVFAFGATSETPTNDAWTLKFEPTYNVWYLNFANSGTFRPIAFPNSIGALWTLKQFSGPVFQNGYAVINPGPAYTSAKVRLLGTAAPISGTYEVGDIVYNSAPVAGGTIGFVCTTAGTPGTWKTFGAISP